MYCKKLTRIKAAAIIFFATFLLTAAAPALSQEKRLADRNTIGWLASTGTFQVSDKFSIHAEYQWRRVDGFKNWQQSLLRSGITYAVKKQVSIQAGYAFAETFPYGAYPVGAAFPEHRIYAQVLISNPIGKTAISHRFTLEQRFLGRVTTLNEQKDIDWLYVNRIRYRIKAEVPVDKQHWSVALQDEVFIGWGKNAGANIFDQNRFAALLGYRINQNIKLEAGFLSQIVQQGKRVNNAAVFQYNNGFMLSSHFSLDLSN